MPPPAVDDFPPPPREPARGRRRSSVYVDPRNCPFPSEVSDPPPADQRPSRGQYAQSSGRSRRPSVYDDTDYNPPVPDPPADKRSSGGRERNRGDDYAQSGSSRSRRPSVYDDTGNGGYTPGPPAPDPPPAGPSRGDKYYPPSSSRRGYTMNAPHTTTTRRSRSQAPNGPARHVDGSEYDSESRSRPTRRRGSIYAEGSSQPSRWSWI
ncbi:hypothetical protein H0H93_015789 [Arthromyces matolae]|nr:hypothetical protein H0H93_015789 [Arthromyces matolae]